MSHSALDQWITRFGPFFSRLASAATAVAESADHAHRVIDSGDGRGGQIDDCLREIGVAAATLLTVVTGAQRLPPIPDDRTQHYFTAGLQWWAEGATTALAGARRRDGPQVAAAADAMAAGSAALRRAAESLERAAAHRPSAAEPG